MPKTPYIIAAVTLLLAVGSVTNGADFTWNQPDGGRFDDARNWNDGASGVPGDGDVVIFDVFGQFPVEFSQSRTSDRLIARRGKITFDLIGVASVYDMLGGTAEQPGIVIAEQPRDLAEIELAGTILRAADVTIGLAPASSGALTGGTLDADVLRLGDGGTGVMQLEHLSTLLAGRAELGVTASGLGDLGVDGSNAIVEIQNDLVIGGAGLANVIVERVLTFTAGSLVLGREPGSVGRLDIRSGNTVVVWGDVEAGRDGVGVVEMETGATLDVGGELTARMIDPACPPITIVLGSDPAVPNIAVTGSASVDGVTLVSDSSYDPALDDEFVLITAASGLADTPVTETELPVGWMWETTATDTELRTRIVLDPCPAGPDEDCNDNGVRDACDIAFGTSPDCNANEIPDECDLADEPSLDCNANGVPDECDIVDHTSPDCNGNEIPDECDLANGPDLDCNANDVPDECDIASGTSDDCNDDGVPDDCTPADVSSLLDALGAPGAAFGAAVDIDGDFAVVGSPGASPPFVTVFAWRYPRWVRETRLSPSISIPGDGFGRAVGIKGSTVVVGAATSIAGGLAHVFERAPNGEWSETVALGVPPNQLSISRFGASVDTNGMHVIVGARQSGGGQVRGVGFIFARSLDWDFSEVILTSFTDIAVQPGASVGIGTNNAAIVWAGNSVEEPGQVAAVGRFVLTDSWSPSTVSQPDGIIGPDIAVDDGVIAIRTESDDFRGVRIARGPPYAFRESLAQPEGDTFGTALGVGPAADDSGARLAVGASGDGPAGRVYTYRQVAAEEWQVSESFEGTPLGVIGTAVAVGGQRMITGVPTDGTQGDDAGAAWIADLPGPDCNANGVWDTCDILDGTSMDQGGDGVPDECADTCPYDLDESGGVGFNDLSIVLNSWGACPNCLADVNGSGSVGFFELSDLLQAWGDCP